MQNLYEQPSCEVTNKSRQSPFRAASPSPLRYVRASLWCAPIELLVIRFLFDVRHYLITRDRDTTFVFSMAIGLYLAMCIGNLGVAAWLARRMKYGVVRFVATNSAFTLGAALLGSFMSIAIDPTIGSYSTCDTSKCYVMLHVFIGAFSAAISMAFALPTGLIWFLLAKPKAPRQLGLRE